MTGAETPFARDARWTGCRKARPLPASIREQLTAGENGYLAIRTSNPVPALAALTSWSPDHEAALPGLEGCAVVPALEGADLRCEGGQVSEVVRDQQLALDDRK